ncbi:MAG: type II secretion system minor pseudopilin GspJ [Legionellaceae bacterium]|nr:type II secretion system minor pseudopilin GspJ [Legionellaceae bacterium]
MTKQGYTLIEVIIALAIFAILGTISVGLLGRSFDTSARLKAKIDPLAELQLAVARMNRDITQIVERGTSSFIGQTNYAEFVRGGLVNPDEDEAKSTLKRVALLCDNNSELVRKTWTRVDPLNPDDFQEQALLHHIDSCEFSYLGTDNTWVSEWPMAPEESTASPSKKQPPFPRAIKLNLTLENFGDIPLLFVVPGGSRGN